jgi:uncharacterized protein with PQ loop repeat
LYFSKNSLRLFDSTLTPSFRYLPQAWKNYQRGSVVGFSTTGIIIKLIGASFLCINSFLLEESLPVLLYGILSLIQHSAFICQFAIYTSKRSFLLWLPFPLIPYTLGQLFPASVIYTMSIKPLSQIVSHFPQMWVCYKLRTTGGVSMLTHHLNIVGGICGLVMCSYIPPKGKMTLVMYANSLFQAITIYAMALKYDGTIFQSSTTSVPAASTPSAVTKPVKLQQVVVAPNVVKPRALTTSVSTPTLSTAAQSALHVHLHLHTNLTPPLSPTYNPSNETPIGDAFQPGSFTPAHHSTKSHVLEMDTPEKPAPAAEGGVSKAMQRAWLQVASRVGGYFKSQHSTD